MLTNKAVEDLCMQKMSEKTYEMLAEELCLNISNKVDLLVGKVLFTHLLIIAIISASQFN